MIDSNDVLLLRPVTRPQQLESRPDETDAALAGRLIAPLQRLVLLPTARSLLA